MDINRILTRILADHSRKLFLEFWRSSTGISTMRSCISLRPDLGHASVIPPSRLLMRVPSIRRVTAVTGRMVSDRCGGARGYTSKGDCGTIGIIGGSQQWAPRREGTL